MLFFLVYFWREGGYFSMVILQPPSCGVLYSVNTIMYANMIHKMINLEVSNRIYSVKSISNLF